VRITGVTQGSGQVRINFDAPDSDGASAITRYGYSVDGGAVINAGTVSRSLLIKGLRNGGRYSIRVFALNAAGWGAPSEPVLATPKR
jgi:titin